MYKISKCSFAQLRLTKEETSPVLCIVPKNTIVVVCSETLNAYEIKVDDLHQGFVSKEYVVLEGGA